MDDEFYKEQEFDWSFIEFLQTWDSFKQAYDKLLARVQQVDSETRDLYVYNAIYTNADNGRTDNCLYEPINNEYDLAYSIEFKQTYIIALTKEEREVYHNVKTQ